jgi:putative transposase
VGIPRLTQLPTTFPSAILYHMHTVKIYQLKQLSRTQFQRLREAQMEAARVWNACVQMHLAARLDHTPWPGRSELQKATKGRFALHSQSIQMVVHAFLATIETTKRLRQSHPEMKMKYPYKEKRFYPLHWPKQAVCREEKRVILPMGRGRPSLILPIALPATSGACTLVWNNGFELHVCSEILQAERAPAMFTRR